MHTHSFQLSLFAVLCCFLFTLCCIYDSAPIMNHDSENPICDSINDNCDYATEIKQSFQDLSILQLNIRGLLSKQHILKETLLKLQNPPDILLLCETWLKSNTENKVDLPGYKCYHKHRPSKIGGGVSVLVKSTLRSRDRKDLVNHTDIFEYVVVELKTNSNNILLLSGYRPPNSNAKLSLKEYSEILKSLKKLKYHELIIGLDHNYDLLKSAHNTSTSQFLNLNIDTDLTPCITKPTRVTSKTATLIDNVMISNRLSYSFTPYVLLDDTSDHYPCLVLLHNLNKCKKDKVRISKRTLTDSSIQQLNNTLVQENWSYLEYLDVNEGFSKFHDTLTIALDKTCPRKKYLVRHDKIIRDPWITKGLSNSLCRQKRLYKEQLHSNSNEKITKYKSYRNTLKKTLRFSKLQYFNKKCEEFKNNSKKLWQLINQITGKGKPKSQTIECLKINNLQRYSPQEITKGFCDHFANVGKNYAEKLNLSSVLVETYVDQITQSDTCMFMHPTDTEEIKSIIRLLPSKNSSGFDDISNTLLKRICDSIVIPLNIIFNKSLQSGIFPDLMKRADISPLFKSKLENDTNNYRPISLLLTISKILEKIVYKRTYSFMEKTGQIFNSQYGFRSQHSCENAVSELVSEVTKGFQNGLYTAALFLDLSKAFDTLEHRVLIMKLKKYGIRGTCLEWFRSYLSNRKIRVKCQVASSGKTEFSEYQTVNYGTPQGSCLGPLIFLLFTNDLYSHLNHCSSILFADDTTLYKVHRSLTYLKWCLQDDMNTLINWFNANKLTFNVEKTICLLFQPNGSKKEFDVEINGTFIKSTETTKFLGMWLDHHLNWSTHTEKLITKLKRNLNLLKHSQNLMTTDCKKLVYFAHIQSHINYGIILWGNSLSQNQLSKLTRIQANCVHYLDQKCDFKILKILRINSIIELENCKFGYKLVHGMLPIKIEESCMYDNNKQSLCKTHGYNTRNKKIPNVPIKMNKQYRASFLNKGSQSLLKLPMDIREMPNLKSFTNALKIHLFKFY